MGPDGLYNSLLLGRVLTRCEDRAIRSTVVFDTLPDIGDYLSFTLAIFAYEKF
jgi:hypothetical protein